METAKPLEESSARLKRWQGRWDENKLGWQQDEVHPALTKYQDRITGNQDSCPDGGGFRWFVPLCGKSHDMAYLAQQDNTAQVVGVDGIRKALDEFAKEHPDLKVQPDGKAGNHDRLTGSSIALLKGDFFALDAETTGGQFDAVMDRASMVAIDPSLREDYVKVVGKLVKPGGKILLVTIEKRTGEEEALKKGPPFSISEADVRKLYEGQDFVKSVTLLEEVDEYLMDPDSRFRKEGVDSMYELYLLIETNLAKGPILGCGVDGGKTFPFASQDARWLLILSSMGFLVVGARRLWGRENRWQERRNRYKL